MVTLAHAFGTCRKYDLRGLRERFPFKRSHGRLCGCGSRSCSSGHGRFRCLWSTDAAWVSPEWPADEVALWIGEVAATDGASEMQGVGAEGIAGCFIRARGPWGAGLDEGVLGGSRVAQHKLRSAVADHHVGCAMCAPVRLLVLIMMSLFVAAVERVPPLPAVLQLLGARHHRILHRRGRRRDGGLCRPPGVAAMGWADSALVTQPPPRRRRPLRGLGHPSRGCCRGGRARGSAHLREGLAAPEPPRPVAASSITVAAASSGVPLRAVAAPTAALLPAAAALEVVRDPQGVSRPTGAATAARGRAPSGHPRRRSRWLWVPRPP